MHTKLVIYTDGGSRGNPGEAAIGILIFMGEKEIVRHKETIGVATNNQAEYKAIIKALELASGLGAETLECYMDSELVVMQINGKYKVKNKELKPLFEKVREKEKLFKSIEYKHVRRENKFIGIADGLVNKALDVEMKKLRASENKENK